MNFINLIKSKLEGSTAKVKYNGKLSEEFNLSHGLTQGGILSPCLFNFSWERLWKKFDVDMRRLSWN